MSAVVHTRRFDGRFIEARVLLDTCSTTHFVTLDFVQRLKLPITKLSTTVTVNAVNGMETQANGRVELTIKSRITGHQQTLISLVVSKISDFSPSTVFPREAISIPANIPLADPQFHIPRAVDLLINAGTSLSFLSIGQIKLSRRDDLYLQKTLLGWVIVGGIRDETDRSVSCNLIELSQQLTKFWEIEECSERPVRSLEDERCEKHYEKHIRRNSEGRYVVRLPFKEGEPKLGNSRPRALRRFYSSQSKFRSNPELQTACNQIIQEYLDQGHLSRVKVEQSDGYFMPYHIVVKLSSTTTKYRLVLDASAPSDNGRSLNQTLLTGPTIQPKLFEHLLRFRFYRYVVTADIEQMYRQILVDPRDRKYQQILLQCGEKIETFHLNTVTFGVSASPYLAIRTLHQLAEDEKLRFPRASVVVKRDFYVDDLITGADSLEEILTIRDEIIALLSSGGFHIRKWASNHQHALDNLDRKNFESVGAEEMDAPRKTLGIVWRTLRDELTYSVNCINDVKSVTKRHILSEIAKIFDPLGLLGPIVLALKIIVQECWKLKIDWDETVPQALHTKWLLFTAQLHLIKELTIPRNVLITDYRKIQIHGFCDASQSGYGACLYVRSEDAQGRVFVSLACAKSRVAPVKQITIPRLELCGAVLLTRLFNEAKNAFNVPLHRIVFWTDSEIVLCWLKKSPQMLKTFEGNRVAEIQKMQETIEWRHVRSEHNPADALSRGQTPVEFIRNVIWFKGPVWLWEPEIGWPVSARTELSDVPGLKIISCLTMQSERPFYERFSSYSTLINVIAYCLRPLNRNNYSDKILSKTERNEAELRLLKIIQAEQYAKEISQLSKTGTAKSTKLAALDPFLDEVGLLRVGGRLRHAQMPDDRKHPILLPSYHYITDLIIRKQHHVLLHAGIQSTLYTIRHRFWLLDGKNQVRKIVRRCNDCIRNRPAVPYSKMSDLPPSRVNQRPVFDHVGIDFFGPITLKEKEHRNRVMIKGYGCVFVCMATKAVHLEIVGDLSTERFLGALRRFVGRRGVPSHIYSDNGTNFVGANKQLRELYDLHSSEPFCKATNEYASRLGITWHFNPPLSPHFGGLWESAVKSFKHHFYRVTGGRPLTLELFMTLSTEIEAILNSRPICTMSTDPNDPAALTPAHFLIGRPLTMIPQSDCTSIPDNRLTIWRFVTKARQDFWSKWHLEYLSELQKRQKWVKGKTEVAIGSIVLLIERDHHCNRWPLGIITETYPGSDNIIRVVKVKTAQGEYVRNITKLCPLPHVTEVDKP